jgi:glyoxylase-like metal-dependent hydrolase (beta-lactamase superfamily II)
METTPVRTSLKWDVLATKRQGLNRDLPPGKEKWMWVPTSATLIYGERDAVLVDAFLTVEQASAVVEWVAASGKNLTTIYITHGHGDHFFGIGALLRRFPNAKAVATPNVLKVMRQQMSPEFVASFWNARYPGQIPEHLVLPEELKGNVIDLEGRELIVVEVGHTDTDHTDLFARAISRFGSRRRRRLQRCSPLSRRVKRANSPRVDHCARHY